MAKTLKQYLQASDIDITKYLEKALEKGVTSVYNEKDRPENAIRVWVSFDFNDTEREDYYTNVDKWTKSIKAETWGNSIRTFLWENQRAEPTIESVAKKLVNELIQYKILDGKSFDEGKWKNTKNISIYVIYRYKMTIDGKDKLNSNHFVLVMNAKIPHDDTFDFNS
ncbi:hypothetical protein IJ556_07635 [bacterium]|nr:hypothetical protein [bacterium]